ncbi:hypothetical protein OHC33_009189 [Knufia fluminis]|uniref:YAG7-like dimerisation domain-containing protein n=1 Tax=Knufia fluminis TaxID=191047 RepID=A0AAN8EHL7_9EURO|nr:hypothetical protein OHC33_009189 [Knufia fluminis]
MSETSSVRMADSKSAKKRKAKTNFANAPPAETSNEGQVKVNGTSTEDDGGSPYLKELQKQIRNVTKKLTAISKTKTTIAETGEADLDTLVRTKKILPEQRSQIEREPQLQQQLKDYETRQKVFLEFSQDLEARYEKEKDALKEAHEAEIEKLKEEGTQTSTKDSETKVREALQITCQFLHAAAFQRQKEDVDQVESDAYEAVLFHLYQGNSTAINTLSNVVAGTDDKITNNTGEELDYTFGQLKTSAMSTTVDEAEPQETTEPAVEEPTTEEPASDPTIANAGLTELEDTATVPTSEEEPPSAAPDQASIAEPGNAVAESSWNPEASMTETQTGEDWVQVPRDPAETETGAPPAMQQSTSNWADEAGAAAEESGPTPVTENDGFSEVKRERGGRGRGGRGRGFDGRGRGRGGRGEFRGRGGGRGRGGPRGGAPQAAQAS